uniref:Asialoglycoprotein receptor 2 n=1 Tax=Balaenoptera musculus TaxID=9771 RepID=A0A8C0I6K0_BALMU
MARDFQDIQQLDSEENDHQLCRGEGPGTRGHSPRREDPFWKGKCLVSGPFVLQRLCSKLRLSLLVLGFNILLLVAVCVMGSHSKAQLQVELQTLKETFSNFSSSTLMRSWWAHPLPTPLSSLWPLDHATLLLHLKHFPVDMRTLACQLAFLQSNGTECCPVSGWTMKAAANWFSRSGSPGPRLRSTAAGGRHLVVINSREEQKFIAQHTNPFQTWIGLTDSDGSWRWVDGTDYRHNYKNWAATQPDDWQGHELGGSEDCAEIRGDGRWNDDFCQQVKRWVCEIKRNITI